MLSVIFSHILQTIRQEHLKNKRLKNFDLSDLKDKKFSVQDLEQGIVSYWNLQASTGGRWVWNFRHFTFGRLPEVKSLKFQIIWMILL